MYKQLLLDTLAINERVMRSAFNKLTECGTVNGNNRGAVKRRSKIGANSKQHMVITLKEFQVFSRITVEPQVNVRTLNQDFTFANVSLVCGRLAATGEMTVKELMYRKIFSDSQGRIHRGGTGGTCPPNPN